MAAIGINMFTGVLGFFPLCLSGLAIWTLMAAKTKTWLFGAAGAAWIVLAMYSLSNGAEGTAYNAIGWLSIALGLVFFFAAWMYRDKAEEENMPSTWEEDLESRRTERHEKRNARRENKWT